MLALHPSCQVLNHAGGKILSSRELNFLSDYSRRRFELFVDHAVELSGGGSRGSEGGSILLSHAFDHDRMRAAYRARYGDLLVKDDIQCLFWKESLAVSNLIRGDRVDLGAIFRQNGELRFLMPVRNPMDCAISNLQTGHAARFSSCSMNSSVVEVLGAVLEELSWFLGLQRTFPDRFFCYYENAFEASWCGEIASFLEIAPDLRWQEDVLKVFEIKPSYPHPEELLAKYRAVVDASFVEFPDVRERLLAFD
jgi:hypothetical protein